MATRLPRALPLAVREDQCVGEARELLVFLPGVFDVVEDYEAHGFLQAVRETGRAVDMLLVDAHLGYYAARTVLERLRQDVIDPARARFESIRLIGISMGGLLAVASRCDEAIAAGSIGNQGAPVGGRYASLRALVNGQPLRARMSETVPPPKSNY